MYNNWCNGQVCPRYESSQNFVHTDRIEDKISGLYSRYGGYVSGSIVVLMFRNTPHSSRAASATLEPSILVFDSRHGVPGGPG
eukprot:COSAG01_NODE_16648_length_1217_cov_3.640429_1_plen_82_part_10